MATVGYTITGLGENEKMLPVGKLKVIAPPDMSAQAIVNYLADHGVLRQAASGTLQDTLPVDDGN